MKILAIEKENTKTKFKIPNSCLKTEAKHVWNFYQEGIIREIYFTKDTHEAVLILECKDEKEAKKILKTFPLIKRGFINFEIKPLVAYDGFARLFEK